ncbi:HAMP domain-containing histidine kinase [Rhodopirellula sp. JC740]|uniref:histidine kinase n=1 Tax=Rhodopirellula halodulae TaxID=2894198 RepID=A0ABS8NLY5_9BACT|nr:HAMP domain-containing sensor histidine kinase [Rhodopirellula sp. JC740]MCC9644596.1 HAMP domain-containing histidine kinase [Rhodopirellula sp. JC740]
MSNDSSIHGTHGAGSNSSPPSANGLTSAATAVVSASGESTKPLIDTGYIRRLMHDLSAPTRHVTFFSGFIGEALTEPLDLDDARRSLATVQSAAERMQRLTQMVSLHMRTMEQLHTGFADPSSWIAPDAYHLAEVVSETWGSIGGDASELTIKGDTKCCVDRKLMNIPIEQLLRNAKCFADESRKLELVVSIAREGDFTSIRFQDNGMGLDTAYADRICEPFECLVTGKDRREGAGLGLTVTKLVLDAIGGSLKFESDGESGTTVMMSWPHHCNSDGSRVE